MGASRKGNLRFAWALQILAFGLLRLRVASRQLSIWKVSRYTSCVRPGAVAWQRGFVVQTV